MTVPILRFDGRDRLSKRLAKIRERSGNLTPVLNECGEIMQSSIEENFLQGGRYDSVDSYRGGTNRWKDLAPSTKSARKKVGKWPGQILQVSGQLAASITYQVTGNNLEIGTNKVQAALLQHGGKAGRKKKVQVDGRPFIVVQEEDVEDMLDAADNHIMGE